MARLSRIRLCAHKADPHIYLICTGEKDQLLYSRVLVSKKEVLFNQII